MESNDATPKQRFMTRAQEFTLGKWLEVNHAELKAEGVPYVIAAQRATKELGFDIGDTRLTRFVRELNLDWSPPGRQSVRYLKADEEIGKLRTDLANLTKQMGDLIERQRILSSRLDVLTGAIGWLADRCGEKFPPNFTIPQASKNTTAANKLQGVTNG